MKEKGITHLISFGPIATVTPEVKEMLDAGDIDAQINNKVALKLLRLSNTGRDGFILTDFPRVV